MHWNLKFQVSKGAFSYSFQTIDKTALVHICEPSLYVAEDVMYALFEPDEHNDMNLYEVANPNDPTEKHIAVGFDYSLLDDFLNTWKKKKEDLASGKITKEEYFEWKINWPHKNE